MSNSSQMKPHIYTSPRGEGQQFVIQLDDNPHNRLVVPDLETMLHLRYRLNQFVDTQEVDGHLDEEVKMNPTQMIGTAEAKRIARARGFEMATSTLNSAYERGTIPGAKKMGGRWRFPRHEFEAWLTRWTEQLE